MPDETPGPGSPTNGHRMNGSVSPISPFSRPLPDGDDAQAPLDLVAVQVDDELVNALGARTAASPAGSAGDRPGSDPMGDLTVPFLPGGGAGDGNADDRLVAMLGAWRAEIDAVPIPELVDLDTAVAAVNAGISEQTMAARRRRAGRLRQLAPLAAAAAIIVATVTGVGLGSQNAMPGDTLWAVQKVVNPERADSVEAKVKVESRLETVRAALKNGDTATAAKELDAIRTEIPAVRGQEGQPQLAQEQEFLAAKLVDTPPGQKADLSTPPKSNPAARPTSSPASPPVPPADASAVEPSPSRSPSATKPEPTEPDVRRTTPDRGREAIAPAQPDRAAPAEPAPQRSEPQVTRPPEVTPPESHPDPAPPVKSEGKPDPTEEPAPVEQPPASKTDPGAPGEGAGHGASSDSTTTAAGAAGADVETTATDTAVIG